MGELIFLGPREGCARSLHYTLLSLILLIKSEVSFMNKDNYLA